MEEAWSRGHVDDVRIAVRGGGWEGREDVEVFDRGHFWWGGLC